MELVVTCDGYEWKWEGYRLAPPPGTERAAPCTFRMDVIIALAELPVVLAVLSRTPIEP